MVSYLDVRAGIEELSRPDVFGFDSLNNPLHVNGDATVLKRVE